MKLNKTTTNTTSYGSSIMSRDLRIMAVASTEALKSTQNYKHGAVITGKGGKVLCSGYNKGNRSKVLDNIFTCVHAEMDVINKFINGTLKPKYGSNFLKHTKKYNIWVVRLRNTDEIKYTMSKPCFYCCSLPASAYSTFSLLETRLSLLLHQPVD